MVTAVFDGSTTARVRGLWQYDYGQVLRIEGLRLDPAVEIHFSLNETGGESTRRIGITKDGVTDVVIPDSMLEDGGTEHDYDFYAWVYVEGPESGKTTNKIILSVRSRPMPEAFQESGETTFGALMEAVNKIAAGKADGFQIDGDRLLVKSGETVIQEIEMNIDGGTFEDWRDQ